MQGLHVNRWLRLGLRVITEHPGRTMKKLIAPLVDLVRMEVKILRQLDQDLSPLIAATATFALSTGLWFQRGRLAMVFPSLAASCCCCAENPPIPAAQISRATSVLLVSPQTDDNWPYRRFTLRALSQRECQPADQSRGQPPALTCFRNDPLQLAECDCLGHHTAQDAIRSTLRANDPVAG